MPKKPKKEGEEEISRGIFLWEGVEKYTFM